eukprot:tig00000480_g1323.t1
MLVLCVLFAGLLAAELMGDRDERPRPRPPKPRPAGHGHPRRLSAFVSSSLGSPTACTASGPDAELGAGRAGAATCACGGTVIAAACTCSKNNLSLNLEPCMERDPPASGASRRPGAHFVRVRASAARLAAFVRGLWRDPIEEYRRLEAPVRPPPAPAPAAARWWRGGRWRGAWSLARVAAYILSVFLTPVLGLPELFRLLLVAGALVECLRDRRSRNALRYLSPVLVYLALFSEQRAVPAALRPPIVAGLLPAWDRALLGARADEIFAQNPSAPLDLLAGLCYGVMHYLSPFFFFVFLWSRSTPALKVAARAFGRMNTLAVLVQFLFPTCPPWYDAVYGPAPPDYSMLGNAAGLLRVDRLLGASFFGPAFERSPLVFGSFPSLHACWPLFFALFGARLDRLLLLVFLPHALWVAWAVLYLRHHFLVDVLAGHALALATSLAARDSYARALRAPCPCELELRAGPAAAAGSASASSGAATSTGSCDEPEREPEAAGEAGGARGCGCDGEGLGLEVVVEAAAAPAPPLTAPKCR